MRCSECNTPHGQGDKYCDACGFRLPHPCRPAAAMASSAPDVGSTGAAKRGALPASWPVIVPGANRAPELRTTPDDRYLGQVINRRFKIEHKLDEDGEGNVYRAVQLGNGRQVALKLLPPTRNEKLVAQFRREGMAMSNLFNAHTITTYDVDQAPDGTFYIATELLEGKRLRHVFDEEGPLEWRRMLAIVSQMCSSLAEAHLKGIVHRALKPDNVYLERRPEDPEFVKISDFGFATIMRERNSAMLSTTAMGMMYSGNGYMSPEQLLGKAVDGRSDIYTLGLVAYEGITGRLPFNDDLFTPWSGLDDQARRMPAPPSRVVDWAKLPRAVDHILLKCLAADKHQRYADVTQLAAALQDAIGGTKDPPTRTEIVVVDLLR